MRADLLTAIGNKQLFERLKPEEQVESSGGSDKFGQAIFKALEQVDERIRRADDLTKQFAAGEPVELHDVMISVQEANLALATLVQVRNKAVEAYQEVMRMQI
jgi:flagellar hook-basal body complex protein FliE